VALVPGEDRKPWLARATASTLGLVIALGVVVQTRAAAPPNPHPTSRFVVSHAELPSTSLQLGRAQDATLRGPDVHRYRVALRRGQFAAVELRQVQGNLAAVVFDPDGDLVDIVDQNGAGQREVVTVGARKSGDYVIQVAVFEWDAPDTRYTIEWRKLERAQQQPVARARQLFSSWYEPQAPGAAIIVLRDGRIVYQDAIGLANVELRLPLTTRTPVDLASVSKQFTGYAIAMLAASGQLRLDDDLRKYLPEIPDYGKTITIRHLLEHKSGLRDWDGLFGLTGRRIEDAISTDEVLAMLARQTALNFAPGSRQEYSNSGYVALALVVERVTGQPFDAWMQANVFRPLGMRQCRLERARAAKESAVTNSYRASYPASHLASAGPMITLGSSSLECSAQDLTTWLANYSTGRLGGPAVLALVTQPAAAAGDPAPGAAAGDAAPNAEAVGPPPDYVFGNWHATRDGVAYTGHQGLAAGYRTSMHSFPERDLTVIYLANDGNDATYPRAQAIEDLFLGIERPPVEAPTEDYVPSTRTPLAPGLVASYLGTYVSTELPATYTIEASGGGIVARHARLGTVPLLAQDTDAFASPSPFLPSLTFNRDEAGHVTGFTIQSEDVGKLPFRRIAR
jgi:CubicO group peptidase (beta-lactamase class C family)